MSTRLSLNERKVLAAIQFLAHEPLTERARFSGLSRHVFEYALRSLRERALIHFSPLTDLFALGYSLHSLQFAISSRNSKVTDSIRTLLQRAPNVMFAAESGGEFQFGVTLAVRSPSDVENFLRKLAEETKAEIFQKQFVSHLATYDFRADYIYHGLKKGGQRMMTCAVSSPLQLIDELDHRILGELCVKGIRSQSELARAIGEPTATIQFRIKRLEEKRIIIGYRYLIATHKLGMQRLWLALQLKDHTPQVTQRLLKYCEQSPLVRYASSALGAWDFDIGFDGKDGQEHSAFIQGLYDAFSPHISRTQITPVFSFLRVAPYPFRAFRTSQK